MAQAAGIATALTGGAVFLRFTALFVAGEPKLFALEWMGLIVLQAGLAAGVLFAHGREQISRYTMIAVLAALAAWTTISVTTH